MKPSKPPKPAVPDIPPVILGLMHELAPHLDTDDWMRVKMEIVRRIPWRERTLFSKRNPRTKQAWTNEFEEKLITLWCELTGRMLAIKPKAPKILSGDGKDEGSR